MGGDAHSELRLSCRDVATCRPFNPARCCPLPVGDPQGLVRPRNFPPFLNASRVILRVYSGLCESRGPRLTSLLILGQNLVRTRSREPNAVCASTSQGGLGGSWGSLLEVTLPIPGIRIASPPVVKDVDGTLLPSAASIAARDVQRYVNTEVAQLRAAELSRSEVQMNHIFRLRNKLAKCVRLRTPSSAPPAPRARGSP